MADGIGCAMDHQSDLPSAISHSLLMFTDLRHAIRLLSQVPGLHRGRRDRAHAGHRRQHRHLQHRQRRAAQAAAVRRRRSGSCRSTRRSSGEPDNSSYPRFPRLARAGDRVSTRWPSYATTGATLTGARRRRRRCPRAVVSPELFSLLGVAPLRGRVFTADDDKPGRRGRR